MRDNIILEKIWEDSNLIELTVVLSSSSVCVKRKLYTNETVLFALAHCMKAFLNEKKSRAFWKTGEKGSKGIPLLALEFYWLNRRGHICIIVNTELEGDEDVLQHCQFCIKTEIALLENFANKIEILVQEPILCAKCSLAEDM